MSQTTADIGYNSRFGIEGETPGTYADVAEVISITPPGMTRGTQEATHLQSPDDHHEHIALLSDSEEASFTVNFVPSATDTLFAAFNAKTGKYQITYPNGVMLRFAGIVTGYTPPELTPEGKMEATVTVKPSGKPTLHAAE
ncbi:phage tail tube protein [Roseicitreum antarcticum]|uniref:Lambda phage tail tube protein N-terminal domain-containing protein n=1 Tax=Roseicitreum antarcticum TaxID=564137 RepID=A0A1H2WC92_9RHOB|nr:phage tail tube protein [Roseicitreum antarcticum]SDW78293.1 hypothetical protein SAMN04488238_103338 [Roseicitreum antarcticum]